MSIRAGTRLRISDKSTSVERAGARLRADGDGDADGHYGEVVSIWSGAPGPGCYWALLETGKAVMIRVREIKGSAAPNVKIVVDDGRP